ncbi:MAG: hypothetical protein SGPRY_001984 [Prymnesium sp.]
MVRSTRTGRSAHKAKSDPRLHDDEIAPRSLLRLEHVTLQDFKSYAGKVRVGPFHPSVTTIVGPNGCGKSCLIEGICFALGIETKKIRSSSLEHLVHQSVQSGDAAVELHFDSRDSTSPHTLTVRRRLLGGKPQRSPSELLHFLEELVGTDRLRLQLEDLISRTTELHTQIDDQFARVAAEKLQMQRYERCFVAFNDLERSRRRLEHIKLAQLRRELPIYRSSMSALHDEIQLKGVERTILLSEQQAAHAALNACKSRLLKNSREVKNEEAREKACRIKLEECRSSLKRVQLNKKLHATAVKRSRKAFKSLKDRRSLIEEEERSARLDIARATEGLQQAQVGLSELQPKLLMRERLMEQVCNENSTEQANKDRSKVSQSSEARLIEIEVALREMASSETTIAYEEKKRQEVAHEMRSTQDIGKDTNFAAALIKREREYPGEEEEHRGQAFFQQREYYEYYAKAVNAALAAALQSTIIVEDKEVAMVLVELMRSRKAGLINCIILSELPTPMPLTNLVLFNHELSMESAQKELTMIDAALEKNNASLVEMNANLRQAESARQEAKSKEPAAEARYQALEERRMHASYELSRLEECLLRLEEEMGVPREGLRSKENQLREQKVMSSKELEEEARQAARIIEEQIGKGFDDDSVLHCDRDDHDGGNISSMESCTDLPADKVLLERTRMELKAEEKVFAEKQQKLDVTGLSVYLDASSRAQEAEGELKQLKATADQASQKPQILFAEGVQVRATPQLVDIYPEANRLLYAWL